MAAWQWAFVLHYLPSKLGGTTADKCIQYCTHDRSIYEQSRRLLNTHFTSPDFTQSRDGRVKFNTAVHFSWSPNASGTRSGTPARDTRFVREAIIECKGFVLFSSSSLCFRIGFRLTKQAAGLVESLDRFTSLTWYGPTAANDIFALDMPSVSRRWTIKTKFNTDPVATWLFPLSNAATNAAPSRRRAWARYT